MHAENTFGDDCTQRHVREDLIEVIVMRIIHCLCLETLLELRVEAVVFVDGLQLMISSQQMHLFWQCQFE